MLKFVVLAVSVAFFGGLASSPPNSKASRRKSSSWLPGDAESVKALEAVQKLPGGELAPAVVVFERREGLTDDDKQRITTTRTKLDENRKPGVLEAQEPVFAPNGKAALIVQPVQPGEGVGDRFQEASVDP